MENRLESIGLTQIVWNIILVYFAFVHGISQYLQKFTISHEDLVFVGRKNSLWLQYMHFYPLLLRYTSIKKFMVGYEMMAEYLRSIFAEQSTKNLQELTADE